MKALKIFTMDPEELNRQRGTGFGSRLLVSPEALPEGSRFEKRSEKYCEWFDETGKHYKSSKDVEAALTKRRLLAGEGDTETETETSCSEYEPSLVNRRKGDAG